MKEGTNLCLLAHEWEFWAQFIHNALALQIPDLDALLRSSNQPVSVRAKAKSVDDVTGIQRIQALAFRQVPQHGHTILAAASTEGTIWRHRDRVHVPGVTDEVGAQLAVGQVPHLHQLVPAAGDDDRSGRCRREAHAAHPASMCIRVLDSVLTLSQRIPQLDGFVPRARHDLSVIDRECNAENILGMSYETPSGRTCVQIPQSQGSVPGSRQRKLTIGRDDNVLDKVCMTSQPTPRKSVVSFFSGKMPNDDALVP